MKYQKNKFITLNSRRFSLLVVSSLLLAASSTCADASSVQKKQSSSTVPIIYPRSAWSNSVYEKRTKKIWPAEFEDPKAIIIHHTATSYKSSTSKQIKKIYKYHSYTRKWGDIGYNYIIGKDGSIFEGRYGGNGVIGGHSYYNGTNYNKGSIGIAVLGNYEKDKLSAESTASLEKLLGWLTANNGIQISSDIKFYKKNLNSSVIGHRNVASTACPGKNIYNKLASIKTNGEALASTYKGYAYKISGESESYEITKGKRYTGSERQPVIELSSTQMKAYSLAGETPDTGEEAAMPAYPSGTLFRNKENGKIGLLENGYLKPIVSEAVLKTGYKESNAVEISEDKWNEYPAGEAKEFRSGSFLKNGENYYFISEQQKRRASLSQDQQKYVDFGTAQNIDAWQIAPYVDGSEITSINDIPSGAILTTNFNNFYFIDGVGIKKKVSKSVYQASFSDTAAVKVSRQLLKSYKTSGNLSFQNGSVVRYNGKYYFIENGKKRMFKKKSLIGAMGFSSPVKAKRKEMEGIIYGRTIE
jgi:hypothetical protein